MEGMPKYNPLMGLRVVIELNDRSMTRDYSDMDEAIDAVADLCEIDNQDYFEAATFTWIH